MALKLEMLTKKAMNPWKTKRNKTEGGFLDILKTIDEIIYTKK